MITEIKRSTIKKNKINNRKDFEEKLEEKYNYWKNNSGVAFWPNGKIAFPLVVPLDEYRKMIKFSGETPKIPYIYVLKTHENWNEKDKRNESGIMFPFVYPQIERKEELLGLKFPLACSNIEYEIDCRKNMVVYTVRFI